MALAVGCGAGSPPLHVSCLRRCGAGDVFRSTDGGQTWAALGSGLSAASVTSLALDAPGEILHAGIDGGAVAQLSLTPDRPPVQPAAPSGHRTRQLTPR